MRVVSSHCWTNGVDFNFAHEPPWYGTVRPVVWEGGITKAPLPDVRPAGRTHLEVQVLYRPDRGNC